MVCVNNIYLALKPLKTFQNVFTLFNLCSIFINNLKLLLVIEPSNPKKPSTMFLTLYFSFNFHSQSQVITFSWAYGWAFRPMKSFKNVPYMFGSCLFSFPTLGYHFNQAFKPNTNLKMFIIVYM